MQLLHFRLLDKLGEGGMGEVWRAIDTTLDREVAIKVLPPAFATDRERLARFEREAKVLASLNHPNVAAIYGFPETGSVRFLAMELVRGEDLAQILARGPMPIREALDAARQIAAALEAAHDSGIIHRDLKPANVRRTPEGQIKVLDFGLAKALEMAGPASGASATVTSAGSQAGMILGTASYMSPEQARGFAVDKRTDLWAFGCVLYEMLSGRKAFDGPTVTDVLAAVVAGEPDWDRLPVGTPASVRRLLRRCLEKDMRRRLRDAGDASLLLDENPEDARSGPVPAVPSAPARRSFALPILGALIAVAGVAAGWWLSQGGPDAKAAGNVEFTRVTYAEGMMRSARFAPDGRTIVYGAAWNGPPIKLYLARTESPDAAPIPVPAAELFAISKNGEMAVSLGHAFFGWMAEGTLARTSLLGGAPREVLPGVRAADWSPDGSEFAIVRRVEGFDQLEYPPGKVLDKTTGYFESVRISPDGEHIAYADHPAWGDNQGGFSLVDRSGKKTKLAEDFAAAQGVAWAPGGKEIWFTAMTGDKGSTLFASDLTGRRRVVYTSIASIELFDISADGRVLLGSQRQEREAIALLAGDKEPRELIIPGETSIVRAMTADGKSLLIANQIPKDYETYLIRSDRPGAVRLSVGESMAISPDGAWALTASASYDVFSITPTAMGPTRTLPNPDGIRYLSIASWLPDSKRFICTGRKGTEPERAYVVDATTGGATPFPSTGQTWPIFGGPPVTQDGREVVYQDSGGMPRRWKMAGGDPIPIPGILSNDVPLSYTEDGQGLYVAGRKFPIEIERLDLATGRRTPWLTLAPHSAAGMRFWIPTISPNGKYWALSTGRLLTDLYLVDGLR
jgi:dipeptidyl aminopeptidase/acylaminoacyl peptidase